MTLDLIAAAGDIDDIPADLPGAFQWAIKVLIAIFLFGVSLDSRTDDFRAVARRPDVFAAVLLAQYVLMPAFTLVLLAALDPHPSVALGMIFVVCCPSGSVSNLITHRAHDDVALSVSLTTVSNAVALVATPAAFAFWGSRNADTDRLMTSVSLDATELAIEIVLLIGVPFALGVWFAHAFPHAAERLRRPVEVGTLVLLILLATSALAGRIADLAPHLGAVALAVLAQNALSFALGYGAGRACRLPDPGRRAMTIEVGMRNTGLALVLVIAYFDGLGGAVLLVAAWAVWDVVFGLALAQWWRRRPVADQSRVPL